LAKLPGYTSAEHSVRHYGSDGGLDFTPNQCVRSEAIALPNVALYMNTGWPGTDFQVQFKSSPKQCGVADNLCLAYNYGFHAAAYALAYANSQLVHSSTWWLDVETENSWTTNALQNRAALEGMVAAIQQKVLGSSVGFRVSGRKLLVPGVLLFRLG
jgi:hypothetical protein